MTTTSLRDSIPPPLDNPPSLPSFGSTFVSKLLNGKAINWFRGEFNKVSEFVEHPVTKVSRQMITIFRLTISLSRTIFSKISPASSDHPFIKGLGKVSLLGLVGVPFTYHSYVDSVLNFLDAVKSGSREMIIQTALRVSSAFGAVIETPAKIAGAVNQFVPVAALSIWGGALGVVAMFLSTASMISTGLSHRSTNNVAKTWLEKGQTAFLEELQNKLNAGDSALGEVFSTLKEGDKTALKNKLQIDVTESLKLLGEAGSKKQLKKIMVELTEKISSIDPEMLKELEDVGNKAYIECLKNADSAVLSKHFRVQGTSLKEALDAIEDSAKERHRAVTNLRIRVKDKLFSDELSIGTAIIAIVASTILTVSSFVAAASPAAPIGIAMVVGLSVVAVVVFLYERKRRKEFEEAIGMNALKDATVVPNLMQPSDLPELVAMSTQ